MFSPARMFKLKGTKDHKQTPVIGNDKLLFYLKFHLKKLVHSIEKQSFGAKWPTTGDQGPFSFQMSN